jgi:AmmeMemoRadiSam system protein B
VIYSLKKDSPVDVFIVFGMHLHPNSSNYIMVEGAWETPFGPLEIESDLARRLTDEFIFKVETANNYTQDNTIELQLPFIKYFFPEAKIVPLGVPPHEKSLEIGEAAARISAKRGLKTRIIGSTDLTHYGFNYGFIPEGTGAASVAWVRDENDQRVINAMLSMDPVNVIREALTNQNACCSGAASAAIAAGKALGAAEAKQIAYATSYDKSPGDSFVGYVGILF